MHTFELMTTSAQETRALAHVLGNLLQCGDVLCLTGSLGAGKTQFAKGIARGLGVEQEITSPTYTLIAEYEEGRIPFVHMDLYRLYEDRLSPPDGAPQKPVDNVAGDGDPSLRVLSDAQLQSIDFLQYVDGQSVLLVEWPQGVVPLLPDRLDVHLSRPTGSLACKTEYSMDCTMEASGDSEARQLLLTAHGNQATDRLREWVTAWQS